MGYNKTYAVLGLGRYGTSVAKALAECGAEVMAVDKHEDLVNEIGRFVPLCRCADVTDPDVIEKLDIGNIDVVIIAIAGNLEAEVMATTLCKEAGAKNIIVKCRSHTHARILERIGADKVVFPEEESGERLAKNLLSSGFADAVELSKDVSVVELDLPDEWAGKNLTELHLRKKYSLNVVAIRTDGELCIDIDPLLPLTKEMKLVVITKTENLKKLRKI